MQEYIIWNSTDSITATGETFSTIKAAKERIKELRAKFTKYPGYYYTNEWKRIPPSKIAYKVIPTIQIGDKLKKQG